MRWTRTEDDQTRYLSKGDYSNLKVKLYLCQCKMPEDIIDDILYWTNASDIIFNIEERYRLADMLYDIFIDDRFIIYECEVCGETAITADLTQDEADYLKNPNGLDFNRFMAADKQLCPDCDADQY